MINKTYKLQDLAKIRARCVKANLKVSVDVGKTRRQLLREIVKSVNKNLDESVIDTLLTIRNG